MLPCFLLFLLQFSITVFYKDIMSPCRKLSHQGVCWPLCNRETSSPWSAGDQMRASCDWDVTAPVVYWFHSVIVSNSASPSEVQTFCGGFVLFASSEDLRALLRSLPGGLTSATPRLPALWKKRREKKVIQWVSWRESGWSCSCY